MQTVNIETTQNVILSYEIATLGDRILAYIIDSLIMTAYVILVVFVGALLLDLLADESYFWVIFIFYFMEMIHISSRQKLTS